MDKPITEKAAITDKMRLQKLFDQEEEKAEILISRVYLFFALPLALIFTIIIFVISLLSHKFFLNYLLNMITPSVLFIYYLIVFILIKNNLYNSFIKYISVFVCVSAFTLLIAGYSISYGWIHSLRTVTVCCYFAVIAVSGLYHNPKLPIFAGLMSSFQYSALFFYAYFTKSIIFGSSENFYAPTYSLDIFSLYNFAMIMCGFIIAYIAQRFRETLDRSIHSEAYSQAMKELDEQKTSFFSNVSHEIRTPLTLLLSPLESMINENMKDFPEKHRNYLNVIYANALRLLKLINNLLDFSKVESGKMEVNKQKTDVIKTIEYYLTTISAAAENKHIKLELIKNNMNELIVSIDRMLMEKAVFNLFSNALKFTPDGGQITVEIMDNGDTFSFSVKDTGIGIPSDKLDYIFERFSQVDSSLARKYEGTGIGLSLAKDIIKLHNGSIKVESELTQGSKFIVTVPKGKPDDNAAIDDIQPIRLAMLSDMGYNKADNNQKEDEVFDAMKKTILIAEDNKDMRDFIHSILENSYNVIKAVNGREGLEKLKQYKPDMVISDVMMPEMNGYELASAIKASHDLKNIPIILLTAKADTSMRLEGLSHGADDYLLKPFNAKELSLRVSNIMKNRELQTELAKKERETQIDFKQAAKVQKSILTPYSNYSSIPGLEIAVRYIPTNGSTSGDYYHISPLKTGPVSVFLSDASGHGVQAALTTMQIDLLNKDYLEYPYTNERLELINRRFTKNLESSNFITAFLVDIESKKIRYSSAAHPAQYLIRPSVKKMLPLKTKGGLIGIVEDSRFETVEEDFLSGDVLLLYTDGAFEEFNQFYEEWGEERLTEFLLKQMQNIKDKTMDEFLVNILNEINDFSKKETFNDDVTLIAIRKK